VATRAEALAREAIAIEGWEHLFQGQVGEHAEPRAVEIEGEATCVERAEGLLAGSRGPTRLSAANAAGPRIVVDFGCVVSGWVELGVRAANGGPIRLAYSEARQFLGRDGDAATEPDDFFYQGYVLGSDAKPDGRVDVFGAPAWPVVQRSAGLRGAQRYLAISLDGPGEWELEFVRVRQTNFQSGRAGHFVCSDDLLNRAWYASAHTTELATIRNTARNPDGRWVIVDGPKRDRLAYGANLSVAGVSAYYQDDSFREVMRDTLNVFAFQQEPDGTLPAASEVDVPCKLGDPGPPQGAPEGFGPPAEAGLARLDSYGAWWVTCLLDYLRHTGDADFVGPLLPVARRMVGLCESHAGDGALWRNDLYGKTYSINWHPPDPATGIDAWENASYWGTLRALAALEREIAGDETEAARLEALAARVKDELLERLWDPEVGAMLQNTEAPTPDHTGDGTAAMLLFGLLDAEQARQAIAFLDGPLASPVGTLTTAREDNEYMTRFVSPYIVAQEAAGRVRYGDEAGAVRLLRQCWGAMLEFGPGTTWEQVGADGTPGGAGTVGGGGTSLAHPWASAVPLLSVDLLGVRPLVDGFRRWAVEPHPADLEWAQGSVPTPAGPLAVRWRRDGASFALRVEAPAGTSGRVAVPLLGKDPELALDGETIWRDAEPCGTAAVRREGDRLVVDDLAGEHTLAWDLRDQG
jgi:hypothetical protein